MFILQWDPPSLNKVKNEDLDLVFKSFEAHLELQIPEKEECRLALATFCSFTVCLFPIVLDFGGNCFFYEFQRQLMNVDITLQVGRKV